MPDTWEIIDSNLEPAAKLVDYKMKARISTAISLKRIADILSETNEYGEGPAAAIGGVIARSLRNAR